MPNDLQLQRRLPARDQHHAGDPGGVGRDRGPPHLNDEHGAALPGDAPVERVLIRADGAARGNPGPAAAGAVIIDLARPDAYDPDCPPVAVVARPLGLQTNNFAEYTAVILALERARALGAREVELVLDSQLIVEQLSGRWKVRHPAIRLLVDQAQALLAGFDRWSIRHEPRASNRAADALANLALDDPATASRAERAGSGAESAVAVDPVGTVLIGATCAIFDQRGVLLVRHSYGRKNWELPGGAALPGESPWAAAQRELLEETGLSLAPNRLTGIYFEPSHEWGPFLHVAFRTDWMRGLTPSARPPEIDDLGFWPVESLPRPISDFTERRILDALADDVALGLVESRRWRE